MSGYTSIWRGIRSDNDAVGFKKIVIRPYPVSGLDSVSASHESPYGRIASKWVRRGGGIDLEVTIPPNTSATIYVPGKSAGTTVGSGTYSFHGE